MSFKDEYNKAETGGDLDRAIERCLTVAERDKLIEAMEIVEEYTGLDMRQEYLMMVLKAMKKVEKRSRRWGIWAMRSSLSHMGPAESWCKRDGEVMIFEDEQEAQDQCDEYNDHAGPNVAYQVREYV